jgi:type 1 glutamine amidotransferase
VWCHDFGGGRVFYSGLGHTSESYSEPYMVSLLTGGLAYAVGK